MILKTLKIIPILAGTMNAPVLDTPKKANNDQPINVASGTLEDDTDPTTYRAYILNDLGEETNVRRVTRQYYTNNESQTPYGTLDMKCFSESYYTLNQQISSKPLILEDNNGEGKTNYHSMHLQCLRIYNVSGYNTIYLENMMRVYPSMWMHSYTNQTLNIKWTTYITTSTAGTEYYNVDIEDDSLYRIVNAIKGDYHIQEYSVGTSTITGLSYTTNKPQQYEITPDHDYIINQSVSTEYYIFLLTEVWRTQNVTIPYYETAYTSISANIEPCIIAEQDFCYYEYSTYQLTTVQEVVDLPNLMFTILTLPFSFYSQAFDLTLFPNTQYSFNVGNFLLSVIAVLMLAWILKIIIGLIRK